jgi:hypothetical protein
MSTTITSSELSSEQLLAEVEDILRSAPPREGIGSDSLDILSWLGRASALIENWQFSKSVPASVAVTRIRSHRTALVSQGYGELNILLRQAYSDLRLRTIGTVNIAVGQGLHFEYFDNIRKLIEVASTDVLFVDPYMDADFVGQYLPCIKSGVRIRLLADNKKPNLLPAIKAFVTQHGSNVEVRYSPNLHDRFFFVDQAACYQSGASFKDGPKNSLTTLTEMRDAFSELKVKYERLWTTGSVQKL